MPFNSFLTHKFYFCCSLYLYRYHLIYNNCSCATHLGHCVSFKHFPFDNVSISGVLFRWRGAIFLLHFLPYVNYRGIKYDWICRARLYALCLHRTCLWPFCRDWVRFRRDLLYWNRTVMLGQKKLIKNFSLRQRINNVIIISKLLQLRLKNRN